MMSNHFSPYPIEIQVLTSGMQQYSEIFSRAAERWSRVIADTQPPANVDGEVIKGLRVVVQVGDFGFEDGIYAESRTRQRREHNAIPVLGEMKLDRQSLEELAPKGMILDVVSHEIGHLLGFGGRWFSLNLIEGESTDNPRFKGPNTMREYAKLMGYPDPIQIPIEGEGGTATTECHWRNSIFGNELMTGHIEAPGNPLSLLSIASLEDIGYQVNYSAAEPYSIPTLEELIALGNPQQTSA